MIKVFESEVKGPRFNSQKSQKICGTGAVDDKDLLVTSDHGNARLFVHPPWESWENSVVH